MNRLSDQELVALALSARVNAYAPYSHFRVGAALECENGDVYKGCNIENAAYGSTICAERTALVKAVSEGARSFDRIAIAGDSDDYCWPCGACRQMLSEFGNMKILAANKYGEYTETDLRQLLPHDFGAATMNHTQNLHENM